MTNTRSLLTYPIVIVAKKKKKKKKNIRGTN